jgi:hypothetical protein
VRKNKQQAFPHRLRLAAARTEQLARCQVFELALHGCVNVSGAAIFSKAWKKRSKKFQPLENVKKHDKH